MTRQRQNGDRPTRRARTIAAKAADLTARPMLLAHIQDLLESGDLDGTSTQIYESMIGAWLAREKSFVNSVHLRRFSGELAVDIYKNRERRGFERIPAQEALLLATKLAVPLQGWQLRGRSLLNRDAEGNLKFAHRSIMEYLFVDKFIEDPENARVQIWTDQMKRFWWERVTRAFHRLGPDKGDPFHSSSVSELIEEARNKGDLRDLLGVYPKPLFCLSKSARNHADEGSLHSYLLQFASMNQSSKRWIRKMPCLFQEIRGQNFSNDFTLFPIAMLRILEETSINEALGILRDQQTETHRAEDRGCIIDFTTGLLWQAQATSQISYSVAAQNAQVYKGVLGSWRIPTLQEALSLLPTSTNSYAEFPACYPFSLFDNWGDAFWTTDRLFKSDHIFCSLLGETPVGWGDYPARLRLVKTLFVE